MVQNQPLKANPFSWLLPGFGGEGFGPYKWMKMQPLKEEKKRKGSGARKNRKKNSKKRENEERKSKRKFCKNFVTRLAH